MFITTPDPVKKIIEEYDFSFRDGLDQSYSVDQEAGDTIDIDTYPHAIVLNLVARPSIDPARKYPARQVTIFTNHLLSITKRVREVEEPTEEQKELIRLTVQEISKTIQ